LKFSPRDPSTALRFAQDDGKGLALLLLETSMVSLIFLGLAIVCALISRILLLIAAINISAGWAFGVFLPFGPLFFRLNYPEAARNSFLFRVATLLCVFGFVISQPRMTLHMPKIHPTATSPRVSTQTKTGHFQTGSRNSNAGPDSDVGPTARGERN